MLLLPPVTRGSCHSWLAPPANKAAAEPKWQLLCPNSVQLSGHSVPMEPYSGHSQRVWNLVRTTYVMERTRGLLPHVDLSSVLRATPNTRVRRKSARVKIATTQRAVALSSLLQGTQPSPCPPPQLLGSALCLAAAQSVRPLPT